MDIKNLRVHYGLKHIKRGCNVGKRKESTAEHTYSSIMLARVYLKRVKGLNEDKVLKLLLYHDLVEVYADDIKAWTGRFRAVKKKKEWAAHNRLIKTLPVEIRKEFSSSWIEYEESKTRESLFCHAIDTLDGLLHNINSLTHFRRYGLSEKRLRDIKGKYFEKFPVLKKDFDHILKRLIKQGSLD